MAADLNSQYEGEAVEAAALQRIVEETASEAVQEMELSGAGTLQALTSVCRRFTETLHIEVGEIDVNRDARRLREVHESKVNNDAIK